MSSHLSVGVFIGTSVAPFLTSKEVPNLKVCPRDREHTQRWPGTPDVFCSTCGAPLIIEMIAREVLPDLDDHPVLCYVPSPTAQRIMLEAADWPDRMARHAKELNDTYAAFSGAVEMLLTDLPDFTDACQDGAKCIAEHASTSSVMDLLNAKIFKAEIARLSVTELEERWAAGDLPEPYEVGSEVFPDDLELLQTEESIYLHDDEWYRLSPARQNTRR